MDLSIPTLTFPARFPQDDVTSIFKHGGCSWLHFYSSFSETFLSSTKTSLVGSTSNPHQHVSTYTHSSQLKNVLESLPTTPDTLEVSRFELLNGGSLWTITFPAASGDVASLYLDASGLNGTGLIAAVSEDIAGSTLGGSFYLYSNGGSSAGFPVDAEGAFLKTEDKTNNGTGRSEPLAWNAEADDVRVAIEGLLPNYAFEGEKSNCYLRYSQGRREALSRPVVRTHTCMVVEGGKDEPYEQRYEQHLRYATSQERSSPTITAFFHPWPCSSKEVESRFVLSQRTKQHCGCGVPKTI